MIAGENRMFYVRIRFNLLFDYYFNCTECSYTIFEQDGKQCILKSEGNLPINKSAKLTIHYGAVDDYDEASACGEALLQVLKLYLAKRRIPVKISHEVGLVDSIGKNIASGGMSEYEMKIVYNLFSKPIINDSLGLTVVEVATNINDIIICSAEANLTVTIPEPYFNLENKYYDDSSIIAISLVSSAVYFYSKDLRVSFLLYISAVEALIKEREEEDDTYIKEIEYLQNQTTNVKLKTALGNLKNKSIGQKTRELISRLCPDLQYDSYSAVTFWNKCYDLRSKILHNGSIELNVLQERHQLLHNLVIDILYRYVENLNSSY